MTVRSKTKIRMVAAVLAVGVLVLSACSESDDSSSTASPPPAPAATEAPAPAPAPAATEAPAPAPAPAADAGSDAGDASCFANHKPPRGGGDKYVVYMTSLNIGNAWQTAAQNLGLAVAKMPPFNECIEVRSDLTTPDPESQISQVQSMVAAGADGIISYALSPTAINSAYRDACEQGVVVIIFDATVTEPCAYNVSYITSVPTLPNGDLAEHPFMGYNAMAELLRLMEGDDEIFVSHGVVGTSTDNVHYGSALAALEQVAPDTEILTEYEGRWSSAQQQAETAKALASFPDVEGIFCGYGETGCVNALRAVDKEIPVSGETSNFFRLRLLEGWPGVSIGSPPAQGGIAMKIMAAILLDGPAGIPKDIEVPYQVVTADNVRECTGDYQTEGCNVFPEGTVSDEDTADIFNVMLPEASLSASRTGEPNSGDVAEPYTAEYLASLEQDPSRRYITRNACPDGWSEGVLAEGLDGCVEG